MNIERLVRKAVKEAIECDEYEYRQLEEIICSLDRDITPTTFDRVIAEVMDDGEFLEYRDKYIEKLLAQKMTA